MSSRSLSNGPRLIVGGPGADVNRVSILSSASIGLCYDWLQPVLRQVARRAFAYPDGTGRIIRERGVAIILLDRLLQATPPISPQTAGDLQSTFFWVRLSLSVHAACIPVAGNRSASCLIRDQVVYWDSRLGAE